MISVYNEKNKCCGCEACRDVCPTTAIKMVPDKYGFIYPVIDQNVCIDCGLCKKVCAFQFVEISNNEPLTVYAGINKNRNSIINSSSGGLFSALASITIKNNGIVYGCAWSEDMQAEHICTDKLEDLHKIQGSKYVQSNMTNIYKNVKKQLINGRKVLFTGVPCQIAALNKFLDKEYVNLITADVICHGVPNQIYFKDYIRNLESTLNGKIINMNFRDKSNGWSLLAKISYKKGDKLLNKKIPNSESYYYKQFLNGDIYRDSCYECKYAGGTRQGDFTMGDFWGVEKFHSKLNTKNGVSILLVNSVKAGKLIDDIKEYMELTKSTFTKVKKDNGQLNSPNDISVVREDLLELWLKEGPEGLVKKYKTGILEKSKNIIRTYLPFVVKDKLKRIIRYFKNSWR
ncbi:MAG: Coenzyme F420 hydrogenase/dehydrogenase, beta subunit C-terminal domain [Firmicutes bacterium]|nr:Coenzyme F420 hydrogenase/dehydrogenase, beta subunit C-terminal domain [Bacillota bacterium]